MQIATLLVIVVGFAGLFLTIFSLFRRQDEKIVAQDRTLAGLATDVAVLKVGQATLGERQSTTSAELAELKTDVAELRTDVAVLDSKTMGRFERQDDKIDKMLYLFFQGDEERARAFEQRFSARSRQLSQERAEGTPDAESGQSPTFVPTQAPLGEGAANL